MKHLNKIILPLIVGLIVLSMIIAIDYTNPDEVNGLDVQDLGNAIILGDVDTSIVSTENLAKVYEGYKAGIAKVATPIPLKDEDVIRLMKYKPSLIHTIFSSPSKNPSSPIYEAITRLLNEKNRLDILNDNPEVKKEYFKFMGAEIDDEAVLEEIVLTRLDQKGNTLESKAFRIKGINAVKFKLDPENPQTLEGISFKKDGSAIIQSTGAEISNAFIERIPGLLSSPPYTPVGGADLSEIHLEKIETGDLYISGGEMKIGDKEFSKELDPYSDNGFFYRESDSTIIGKDISIKNADEWGKDIGTLREGVMTVKYGDNGEFLPVLGKETEYLMAGKEILDTVANPNDPSTKLVKDRESGSVLYKTKDNELFFYSDESQLKGRSGTAVLSTDDTIEINGVEGEVEIFIMDPIKTDLKIKSWDATRGRDSSSIANQDKLKIGNLKGSITYERDGRTTALGEIFEIINIENNYIDSNGNPHKTTLKRDPSKYASVLLDNKELIRFIRIQEFVQESIAEGRGRGA